MSSGEVPLSPTIFDADVTVAKQKGAPIEWRPLDPVVTTVGYSALSLKPPHPHAALLFLDYLHSKEGQQLIMKGGLWSPREDIGSLEQKFKKVYLDNKYSTRRSRKEASSNGKISCSSCSSKNGLNVVLTEVRIETEPSFRATPDASPGLRNPESRNSGCWFSPA